MDEALHTIVIVDIHPTEPTSQKKHQSNALCTCGRGWMWTKSTDIRATAEHHAIVDHMNKVNIVRYS